MERERRSLVTGHSSWAPPRTASQAEQGGGVGEDAGDVGAALDFLVEPFEWVGRPDLLSVAVREAGEGEQVVVGLTGHLLDLRQLPAQHHRDLLELLVHVLGVVLGEDYAVAAATISALPALGDLGEHVARKCTRQRCQVAPSSTDSIAALSPMGIGADHLGAAPDREPSACAVTRSRTPRPPNRRRRTRAPHGVRRP